VKTVTGPQEVRRAQHWHTSGVGNANQLPNQKQSKDFHVIRPISRRIALLTTVLSFAALGLIGTGTSAQAEEPTAAATVKIMPLGAP
jgi:hypothetical protein